MRPEHPSPTCQLKIAMPVSAADSEHDSPNPERDMTPVAERTAVPDAMAESTDDSTSTLSLVTATELREEGAEEGYGVEEERVEGDGSGIVEPFDPTRISISTKTPTVDLVIKRLKHGEIDLNPDFQRNAGIWDPTRQSRLIESLLLRIPLPVFYMAADKDNKWQVVDGLQRLYSINRFVLDKRLKLRGMEYLSQFEGAAYDDLPRDMQRRIDETQLAFHVINAGTPHEVMFNVFKRVNTGGKPLTPQEIRHALNPGPARDFVNALAESVEFRDATDRSVSPKRMADRECVLRFIAFYRLGLASYNGNLDVFLTQAMASIDASIDNSAKDEMRQAFFRAMQLAKKLFGNNAFRKPSNRAGGRSVVNKPLFECLSVALARVPESEHRRLVDRRDVLRTKFSDLIADREFYDSISIGTQTTEQVTIRFTRVGRIIDEVTND